MKSKKGAVQNLQPIVVALVSVGLVLVVGFLIMSEVKSQTETIAGVNTTAWNATNTIIDATADIPGWLPINLYSA